MCTISMSSPPETLPKTGLPILFCVFPQHFLLLLSHLIPLTGLCGLTSMRTPGEFYSGVTRAVPKCFLISSFQVQYKVALPRPLRVVGHVASSGQWTMTTIGRARALFLSPTQQSTTWEMVDPWEPESLSKNSVQSTPASMWWACSFGENKPCLSSATVNLGFVCYYSTT